jgi:Protein of unknown function (DUF742)
VTGFFFGPPPDEEGPPEQTFADLVNGFTLGGRKRDQPEQSTWDVPMGHVPGREIPEWVDRPPRPYPPDAGAADHPDAADAAIVRPYAWTRGRTKSSLDLRIEALVTTSELGEDIEALTQTEHRSVAALCTEPRSVAEIATLLHVPLGVAKVLLGDMADLGLVIVHKTATGGANKAHLMLMERVLSGLRRL